MTSISPDPNPPKTYHDLQSHLLTHPTPLYPPPSSSSSVSSPLRNAISSLSLHPTLEALLHLLNQDLASAHFLVRHMQAPPQHEGMYIHGILHRIEGDIDNARCWYADVCGEGCFEKIWGKGGKEEEDDEGGKDKEGGKKLPRQESARRFLDGVEMVQRQRHKPGQGDVRFLEEEVEGQARWEIESLLGWCVEKFGTEQVLDARGVWTQPGLDEEKGRKKRDMLTGGEGYRRF